MILRGLAITSIFVVLPQYALAYIDPGSGSAIMSVIVGLLVAIGVFFKTFWYKLSGFFRRADTSQTKTTETCSDDQG